MSATETEFVGMNDREAAVHRLFFEQKMTLSEISSEMNITPSSAAGLINRMRQKWPALDEVRPRADAIARRTGRPPRQPAKAVRPAKAKRAVCSAPSWTDAEIAIVAERYPFGGASACAARLPGRSETAIRSKAMGLGIRISDRRDVLAREQAYAKGLLSAPVKPASRYATCQWIDADPRVDSSMCGAPSAPGAPYCPHHCARAYSDARQAA